MPLTLRQFLRLAILAASVCVVSVGLVGCNDSDATSAADDPGFINLYSARHYDGDDAIYEAFEKQTGIEIRRIEASGDLLIERIRAEGSASPADVVITVDAGRLWRASEANLFAAMPKDSELLTRVPTHLRDPSGEWVGIAKRARVIVVAPDRLAADSVPTYASLADPALKGRLCVRSSSNIYNLSLLAGMIASQGEEAAETWARAIVDNMARTPQGGDTDQIRAVAAGVCDVALVNHYYWVKLASSASEADQSVAQGTQIVWPDQDGDGVHINVSGIGLASDAPNKANAERFIEFLLTSDVQTQLANSNNEFPATDAELNNPALEALGSPIESQAEIWTYGAYQAQAAAIFDRVGWQ
ncbi:MAG: extracellular solute-binding protein [Pseudomonadaceae bacterium]|nr:extracellular solute-binding protein [Pseudomonadaceae bacterium]